jgi:hypothetical protein
MVRLTVLLFIIIGATLAGIGILAVVSVPSLADHAMRLIPYVALAGFVLGLPVSFFVARAIEQGRRVA